jgi:predicted RNase H-like nuclease (RuvC/YqgF family)
MNEISDVQIGRLIQSVENLERTCERLEHSVEKLEKKVEEQDKLISKGRTALTVILSIAGLVWGGVEIWLMRH